MKWKGRPALGTKSGSATSAIAHDRDARKKGSSLPGVAHDSLFAEAMADRARD
jgi:hypothetical protein